MNASVYRNTKYEVRFLHQGPNAFGLECSERGVPGVAPVRVEVHESLFSDKEMKQIHDALALLEEKFAIAYAAKEAEWGVDGLDAPRAKVHALIREAEEAKAQAEAAKVEAARIQAENIVKRAEVEELDANLNIMRAAVAAEVKSGDE